MADFNKPATGSLWTQFVTEVKDIILACALWLDTRGITPTNVPTYAKRWNNGTLKFEYWNGTAWVDLAALYAISISGNAATATTAGACSGNAASATTAAACTGASASTAVLANYANGTVLSGVNLNTITTNGHYRTNATSTNVPVGLPSQLCQLLVMQGSNTVTQMLVEYTTSRTWLRSAGDVGAGYVWTAWQEVMTRNNIGTGLAWTGDTLNCTVVAPVQSVGGQIGAVTNAQLRASIVADLGYTPANGINYISKDVGSGYPVGIILVCDTTIASNVLAGATCAGSYLAIRRQIGGSIFFDAAPGTWRNITSGQVAGNGGDIRGFGTFQRIA